MQVVVRYFAGHRATLLAARRSLSRLRMARPSVRSGSTWWPAMRG